MINSYSNSTFIDIKNKKTYNKNEQKMSKKKVLRTGILRT